MALLTLGDPERVTGGYLFHRRVADRAAAHGFAMEFVSVPELPLAWAMASAPAWLPHPALRGADVVVLDSIAAAPAAPWLGRLRPPMIGMLHQPPGGMDAGPLARAIRAPFDRWAYRRAELLVAASDWLAQQLADAGMSRSRLRVVPPGKDLDAADPPPPSAEERESFRRGRRMSALCIANWLPRKGILELTDAVSAVADDAVTLHLVGDTDADPPYARRVRARLEAPDVRDRVVVHGLISPGDVRRAYLAVDSFMLPSFVEPYGTVWGEAMAAGLPVVGWAAGNLPFLADHGVEGFLVPVGDVAALGGAIERLAAEPELRGRMGRAAAARAEARPTWDETAARFFDLIAEVVGRRRQG